MTRIYAQRGVIDWDISLLRELTAKVCGILLPTRSRRRRAFYAKCFLFHLCHGLGLSYRDISDILGHSLPMMCHYKEVAPEEIHALAKKASSWLIEGGGSIDGAKMRELRRLYLKFLSEQQWNEH